MVSEGDNGKSSGGDLVLWAIVVVMESTVASDTLTFSSTPTWPHRRPMWPACLRWSALGMPVQCPLGIISASGQRNTSRRRGCCLCSA